MITEYFGCTYSDNFIIHFIIEDIIMPQAHVNPLELVPVPPLHCLLYPQIIGYCFLRSGWGVECGHLTLRDTPNVLGLANLKQ